MSTVTRAVRGAARRVPTTSLIASTGVALVMASGAWGHARVQPSRPTGAEVVIARDALQQAVTRFEATDLEGRRVAVRDLRGRVVILDFWATWCAPCLAEIPRLQRAHARFGDRLAIIGISLDVTARPTLTAWLRRHEVTWPQVHDGRGWSSPIVSAFGLEAIPFSLLVDADGRLAGVNITGERLDRSLEVLLGSSSPPTP